MPTLHNAAEREALKVRLRAVRADSVRRWGVMSAGQMMWHLTAAMEMCMGKLDVSGEKSPLPFPVPKALLRFMIIEMPWPRGAPTLKAVRAENQAEKQYDLEAQRARTLATMDEFAARPLDGLWPLHPLLGQVRGEQYSRLQAKHLNHHLTQFGV